MQQKKIDDLFIDGTHAHIMDINLRQSACDEIQHLIKWVIRSLLSFYTFQATYLIY